MHKCFRVYVSLSMLNPSTQLISRPCTIPTYPHELIKVATREIITSVPDSKTASV